MLSLEARTKPSPLKNVGKYQAQKATYESQGTLSKSINVGPAMTGSRTVNNIARLLSIKIVAQQE